MESKLRKKFNSEFTEEAYDRFVGEVNSMLPYPADFRLSETPLFLTDGLKDELIKASYEIVAQLMTPEFKVHSQTAIPAGLSVPNEPEHPVFLQVDFALAGENGMIIPKLIELQGFPSLYGFQYYLEKALHKSFPLTAGMTTYFSGYNSESYREELDRILTGSLPKEEVILLEIEPAKQKTRIDFAATEELWGVKAVCVSDIIKEGRDIYYLDNNGRRQHIKRIYNRVILDELFRKPMSMQFSFSDDLNVEWLGHPNWFFKISKHTLPFLKGKYAPECFFLSELKEYPADLHNYVLKPLYSFAGLGVEVDVNKARLDEIGDRDDYILQRKVDYAPLIETPEGYSKAEIRMMFIWDKEPVLVNNLVRMSKGKMMGVDFNKNKTWVGSNCAFHQ